MTLQNVVRQQHVVSRLAFLTWQSKKHVATFSTGGNGARHGNDGGLRSNCLHGHLNGIAQKHLFAEKLHHVPVFFCDEAHGQALENKAVAGTTTVEMFRQKFEDDPATFMQIDRATRGETETM